MSYQPQLRPTQRPPSAGIVRRNRRGIPWVAGCALMFFGFVLGLLALMVFLIWYFGTAASSEPLPRRTPIAGTPDVSAQISESYLNAEILRQIKDSPLSINGILSVKDMTLRLLPGEQIEVNAKLGNVLADFDVTITEKLAVQDGKVVINAIGNPKVGKGDLPVSVNVIVNAINRDVVQPRINDALAKLQVNGRLLRLLDITTANQLITARFNAQ